MVEKLALPPAFIVTVRQAFGAAGAGWLSRLPALLAEAVQRWNLRLGEPFTLSYNYVRAATLPDGRSAVLKIGVPNNELTSEINTLRLYDGRGACGLLEADAARGILLLERLHPGTTLAAQEPGLQGSRALTPEARFSDEVDDRATGIAADLIARLRCSVPSEGEFLSLSAWFDALSGLRARFSGTTGPFAEQTVVTVEGILRDLFAENRPSALLHGDLHHENILLSARGWLAVDPKGVMGPAEYEVAPMLINPWGALPEEAEAIRRTERRIAILAERLGFEPERMLAWATCHALLSAWWDLADDGTGGEYSRRWSEIFARMRL